jgi:hypothetical protein
MASAVLAAVAAHAQALPGGAALGMSAQQLQQAVPALQPVPHPPRLAGGLVGRWTAPFVTVAGVDLAPTFYFADGQLQRVEYLAAPGASGQAFESLLAWGRAAWGTELSSQGPEGAYANWATADADVYLQQSAGARGVQLRLVVKRRILKDAGEL